MVSTLKKLWTTQETGSGKNHTPTRQVERTKRAQVTERGGNPSHKEVGGGLRERRAFGLDLEGGRTIYTGRTPGAGLEGKRSKHFQGVVMSVGDARPRWGTRQELHIRPQAAESALTP